MSRVVIVGAGVMGLAIADGLVANGWDDVHVIVRDESRRSQVARDHGVAVHSAYDDSLDADAVVIAVKPRAAMNVATQIASTSPVVISVCAGVTLAQLAEALPDHAPIVRVMPNTPARVGQGVSAVSVGTHVDDTRRELALAIMGAVGQVVVIDEALQDAATAVSGSGPAYVFYFAEAMIEAGVQMGLTRPDATAMAIQTLRGASELLATGEHPSVLREQVTSPGGTTAAALRTLDAHGVRAAIADAMWASHDRSQGM